MTKILLVEDDKSLREIYGVRLLAEGYDIVSAGDGEEALAMAIKEKPGLIVSDVMMPKISGFDMLDILRSTTETKDIRVIMMTALSSEDQRLRGEQLGADRYLVKSQVGIEDVVRTVHEVLGDAPVAQPTAQQTFSQPAPSAVPRSSMPQSVPVPPRPVAPTYTTPVEPQSVAPTLQPAPQSFGAQPQQPAAPQQQPVSQPAPQTMQPVAPATQQQPTTLPQPTAPFSSQRPANLGERIIHPLEAPAQTGPDVASLIDRELTDEPMTSFEQPQPTAPAPQSFGAQPQQPAAPQQPPVNPFGPAPQQ
ncbi:Alkaline phosphatase synthesis transcriptional regulatory protein PhoP [compost metagenome]